jgi:formamidopyrimidine-DNA glycosylase
VGRTITAARVAWRRTVGEAGFERRATGARIVDVRRRAKFFVIELERGDAPAGALVGHLRMSGRVHVEPATAPAPDYGKVALALDDGSVLHFVDVRKFGRLVWRADPELELSGLGPEPLSPAFTAEWLARELVARRRALKPLLLDQAFVAGLGNIYVDESLHRAGLHPLARSDRVRPDQARALRDAIRRVLRAAIRRQGSSFDAFYRTPEGRPGSYQHEFQVYGRTGEPCPTCDTQIARLVVGQRGTHVCPRCQPRRPSSASRPAKSQARRAGRAVSRAPRAR